LLEKIILGTVQLGLNYGINNALGQPARQQAIDILSAAQKSSINKADTAIAYGTAHDIIGEYCRDNATIDIYTKFMVSDMQSRPIPEFLDSLCESLSVERLAGLAFHSYSELRNCSANILRDLKSSQSVGELGVSIYEDDELEKIIQDGFVDYVQIPYNVLDSSERKRELLAIARSKGIRFQARSVYLQGLLLMAPKNFPHHLRPISGAVGEFQQFAKQFGRSSEEAALRYVLDDELIDEVVIGVEAHVQLEQNIMHCNSRQLSVQEISSFRSIDVANRELLNPSKWNNHN